MHPKKELRTMEPEGNYTPCDSSNESRSEIRTFKTGAQYPSKKANPRFLNLH